MDPQTLTQHVLTTWPWQLRVAIGHVLPLYVSIWCLWSLRGYWKHKAVVPFIFALGSGFELVRMLFAGTISQTADGRIHAAVQGNPVPLLWFAVLAVMVAVACEQRIKWQAVWLATFAPLYAIDLILGFRMFPDGAVLLTAIGGAGPIDALLIVPLFAVLLGQVSRLEVLAWPWLQKVWRAGPVKVATRFINQMHLFIHWKLVSTFCRPPKR